VIVDHGKNMAIEVCYDLDAKKVYDPAMTTPKN